MCLYPSDQHTKESQVLSVAWESQIDLRLWMSGQSPPILSTSVSLKQTQILHPALASCAARCQSIGWVTDRKEERKNIPGLLQFKCLTPKQETAEQTDIQAGGRMFCPWEVQLYFHCWQMPCLRQWPLCFPWNTASASLSQRNSHNLGKLPDIPHTIIFPCLCIACWTVKAQSYFPGWNSPNPAQTGLGVSYSSVAPPLSLAFE